MRKCWIVLISALVASAALLALTILSHPSIMIEQSPTDANSVLNEVWLEPVNATIDGNYAVTVMGGDPQLYLSGFSQDILTIQFVFSEPLPQGTPCQLFYSVNGEALSESNSLWRYPVSDTYTLSFQLPAYQHYHSLRLDVETDYSLSDILVSDEEIPTMTMSYWECIKAGILSLRWKQWLLCFIIILAEIALILHLVQKNKAKAKLKKRGSLRDKRIVFLGLVYVLIGGSFFALIWLLLRIFGAISTYYHSSMVYFIFAGMAVGTIFALRNRSADQLELLFATVALLVGLTIIALEPITMLISWDDEIHYARALTLSYGGEHLYTDAEIALITRILGNNLGTSAAMQDVAFLNGLNNISSNYRIMALPLNQIPAYLPMAAGLWLGRLFGLSFTATVTLGKVCNLCLYIIVVSSAIRVAPHGKLLLALLCLLPTPIFLASNYSYDPFCISFMALGISLFLRIYQSNTKVTSFKEILCMEAALFLGCITKQVYFPITLIPLIMPKRKFESASSHRSYVISVLVPSIILLLSFMLPFILQTKNYSDYRGGATISASSQFQFILENPVSYIKTLITFMFGTYLDPAMITHASNGCISSFAYISMQGSGFPTTLGNLCLVMVLLAFFGSHVQSEDSRYNIGVTGKTYSICMAFGALCITATSLYLSFTPVGHYSINGCQERYMLPIVISLLMVLKPKHLVNTIPKKQFNNMLFSIYTILLFAGLLPLARCYF